MKSFAKYTLCLIFCFSLFNCNNYTKIVTEIDKQNVVDTLSNTFNVNAQKSNNQFGDNNTQNITYHQHFNIGDIIIIVSNEKFENQNIKLQKLFINKKMIATDYNKDTIILKVMKNADVNIGVSYIKEILPFRYYNITSDSINVSSLNAAKGDTIRYNINHYQGKQFNELTINGKVADNIGYFIMPDTNVHIKAFYIPIKKKHSIIVSNGIYAAKEEAYQGETIPFTLTNKNQLAYILIDDKKYDAKTQYFVMPDKNVVIEPHYYLTTKDTYQPNGILSIRAYIDNQGRTIKKDIYDVKGQLIRTVYN